MSFHFQVRAPVTSRSQEKGHFRFSKDKISSSQIASNESLNMGTTCHLQRRMAETTFCAKSQLEVNFHTSCPPLPNIARFHFTNMELFVQLCWSSAVTQMWSRVPADFPRQPAFKSRLRQSSQSGHLPSPPMAAPRAPTRSHALFETAHDWASFVGGSRKKTLSRGIFVKQGGGVCSAAPDRLGNFRPVVE